MYSKNLVVKEIKRWAEMLRNQLVRFALWLQNKMKALSVRRQKWVLVIFLVFISALVLRSIKSDFHQTQRATYLQFHSIKTVPVSQVALPPLPPDSGYLILHHIHRMLDSLHQPKYRRTWDSFIARHPRLLDSIEYLQLIYHGKKAVPTK